MVFIVKIPNKNRGGQSPDDPSSLSPDLHNHPSPQIIASDPSLNPPVTPTQSTPSTPARPPQPSQPHHREKVPPSSSLSPSATPSPASPASLDVILAPGVLNHRYVRGVDKSLIVERPERIRAVLLGISGAIGKAAQIEGRRRDRKSTVSPHAASATTADDSADDLIQRLSSLSVTTAAESETNKDPSVGSARPPSKRYRVLRSTRSLGLDPAHPSVAFVHAHSEETVARIGTAYEDHRSKKERRSQNRTKVEDEVDAPAEEGANRILSSSHTGARTTPSTPQVSHAAYLGYLCSLAPNRPPEPQLVPDPTTPHPSSSIPSDHDDQSSSAASVTSSSSSDGEGDEAIHPSEVPEHLPQGDLYLCGPIADSSRVKSEDTVQDAWDADQGGSSQAIRQALGACAEAVDRVVEASRGREQRRSDPSAQLGDLDHRSKSRLEEIDPFSSPTQQAETAAASPLTNLYPSPSRRAFVLSRPPGHHCSGSLPSGFCWVNNAVVAAAHAYLNHGIDRVVIFDIDLHHGNGTQSLAWRINSDSVRHDLDREARLASLRAVATQERNRQKTARSSGSKQGWPRGPAVNEEEMQIQAGPRGLRIFYGSLHDIESFPCEDGDPNLIKDASTCVEGAHGQWIWNVHLDSYASQEEFEKLYEEQYSILFNKARRFLSATSAKPRSTLVLISAGFDACSYEYPGMQRHGKHVPPSFYERFGRDSALFADEHCEGKVVSVLEGGYSDRALCSAAMAHVTGLSTQLSSTSAKESVLELASRSPQGWEEEEEEEGEEAWKLDSLIQLEKMARKVGSSCNPTSSSSSARKRGPDPAAWLVDSSKAFAAFERACGKSGVVSLDVLNARTPAKKASSKRGVANPASHVSESAASSPGNTSSASTTGGHLGSGRVLRDRSSLKGRVAYDLSSPTSVKASASSGGGGGKTKASVTSPRPRNPSPQKVESVEPSVARGSSPPPPPPPPPAPSSETGIEFITKSFQDDVTLVPSIHSAFPVTSKEGERNEEGEDETSAAEIRRVKQEELNGEDDLSRLGSATPTQETSRHDPIPSSFSLYSGNR
ncbi:Arginase/deacetylase [Violaceomyces palustris]|uniref:Arginase/deacetylase n=1 Tax=Violaceomyces palustris TaxID=1673888 RepID=A0ACD0P138_9BASI|nr:Arginase/deacetylase [Violaceomyces palustris]